MTNADKIRNLSDEELVDLLAWGEVYAEGLKVPSCDPIKTYGAYIGWNRDSDR